MSARSALENYLPETIQFLSDQDVAFPIYVLLTVIDGDGCRVGLRDQMGHDGSLREIDRDIAHLPELVVETPQDDVDEHINALMDALFNASGFEGEPKSNR